MYWSPALYHHDRVGVMSIVRGDHYLGIGGDGYMRQTAQLHAFPRGGYIMGDNNDHA
jgi:hypothetical protein